MEEVGMQIWMIRSRNTQIALCKIYIIKYIYMLMALTTPRHINMIIICTSSIMLLYCNETILALY